MIQRARTLIASGWSQPMSERIEDGRRVICHDGDEGAVAFCLADALWRCSAGVDEYMAAEDAISAVVPGGFASLWVDKPERTAAEVLGAMGRAYLRASAEEASNANR